MVCVLTGSASSIRETDSSRPTTVGTVRLCVFDALAQLVEPLVDGAAHPVSAVFSLRKRDTAVLSVVECCRVVVGITGTPPRLVCSVPCTPQGPTDTSCGRTVPDATTGQNYSGPVPGQSTSVSHQ